MRLIMKVLEELIYRVEDHPVRDVKVGAFTTAVTSKRCGLASTLLAYCSPGMVAHDAGSLHTKSSKELAQYVLSENMLEAVIGMAAINSALPIDENSFVEINAGEILEEKGAGKNIAVIGHFPFIPRLQKTAKALYVIEKRPRGGDLSEEQIPDILPRADVIAISGTTLMNHTFGNIIKYCRVDSFKLMLGPSTPLSTVLFDHGIDVISGVLVVDHDLLLKYLTQGVSFKFLKGKKMVSMIKK